MNQIKRQNSFSHYSDVETKKLRIISDEEKQGPGDNFTWRNSLLISNNLSITCLENLSNELFYEIFEYLDACDIHKAFSKLNIRLQNLLTYSLLPLKINLCSKSESTLEHRCRHVIIPNKHRILSLYLSGQSLTNAFFNHCTVDSSFERLESVILTELSDVKLLMILFYLNSLPRLFSLTIQLEEESYDNVSDIYRIIFRLPSLKFYKMLMLDYEESNIFLPVSINEKPSTIEHIVLNHRCSLKELTSILCHTPHLRHLSCDHLADTDEIDTKEVSLTLSNLTHISFAECGIEFDAFEAFIKKISSQLQLLRLSTSWSAAYLDANRWKRLIKNYMPHLSQFHFDHRMPIDDSDDITPNHEAINQFISSFWVERQWFFDLENSFDEFIYSIHPYKAKWFNCQEQEQNIPNSNQNNNTHTSQHFTTFNQRNTDIRPIHSIPLILRSYIFARRGQLLIDRLKSCFLAVPFTHLDIVCNTISIGVLIDTIRLLPNLYSLKVSSLPVTEVSNLSTEDTEMLLWISMTNKITKVKLDRMDEMEQVHFLMNLCPRMQYLEIECTATTNLENIIGSISMNNITRIPYLCSLCLCVPNVNEKIIQNLEAMVDFERLFRGEKTFRDIMVRYTQNKIFLKWKL